MHLTSSCTTGLCNIAGKQTGPKKKGPAKGRKKEAPAAAAKKAEAKAATKRAGSTAPPQEEVGEGGLPGEDVHSPAPAASTAGRAAPAALDAPTSSAATATPRGPYAYLRSANFSGRMSIQMRHFVQMPSKGNICIHSWHLKYRQKMSTLTMSSQLLRTLTMATKHELD